MCTCTTTATTRRPSQSYIPKIYYANVVSNLQAIYTCHACILLLIQFVLLCVCVYKTNKTHKSSMLLVSSIPYIIYSTRVKNQMQ